MAKKPRGSAGAGPSPEPGGGDPLQLNVPPELIAKALTELTDFDLAMASIAGKKGAAIKRYEEQGLDRAVMRGLQTLARGKTPDEAMAFILKLFKYGVAAEVLPKADDKWTTSVKQVEMFVPATGAAAEDLRYPARTRPPIRRLLHVYERLTPNGRVEFANFKCGACNFLTPMTAVSGEADLRIRRECPRCDGVR